MPNELDDFAEEQRVVRLVHSDECKKNSNQVTSLSTHRILFVKRKEFALKPIEHMYFPIAECTSIGYEMTYAVSRIVFGDVHVAFILLFLFAGMVSVGTSVPVGFIVFTAIIGINLVIEIKRHKITFFVQSRKLKRQSKAGDFKYKAVGVN